MQIVYFGPRSQAPSYFEELGYRCPQFTNLADFFRKTALPVTVVVATLTCGTQEDIVSDKGFIYTDGGITLSSALSEGTTGVHSTKQLRHHYKQSEEFQDVLTAVGEEGACNTHTLLPLASSLRIFACRPKGRRGILHE